MVEKWDQRMTMMIEVSVSIYLYALLSLTDYMGENTLRTELGWVLALLTAIVVGIMFYYSSGRPLVELSHS